MDAQLINSEVFLPWLYLLTWFNVYSNQFQMMYLSTSHVTRLCTLNITHNVM
jgi:hypothetical protein